MRIYSSGDAEGRPYIAMEYLSGGNLAELLKKTKRLAPRVAAELVRKIALAIQAAHDLHIVTAISNRRTSSSTPITSRK